MKAASRAIFKVILVLSLSGCSTSTPSSAPQDTLAIGANSATGDARPAPRKARARRDLPLLEKAERRVSLIVVPGDASVEVDGQPVRRRNGLIDLVGKAGETRRVRAFKGARSTSEKSIVIGELGATPAVVDLSESAPVGGGPLVKKAKPLVFSFDE